MPYTIEEHKHRYVAWAASRAASTKTCRFSVQQGKGIIEAVGLHNFLFNPDKLPTPSEIDVRHREWREKAIHTAVNSNLANFSHGIAAKLINVYLKGAFVCAGHESHPNVAALHPPIDKLLLDELCKNDFGGQRECWRAARKQRWSKLTSDQYEAVIQAIRISMNGEPLWQIEAYWRGYQ